MAWALTATAMVDTDAVLFRTRWLWWCAMQLLQWRRGCRCMIGSVMVTVARGVARDFVVQILTTRLRGGGALVVEALRCCLCVFWQGGRHCCYVFRQGGPHGGGCPRVSLWENRLGLKTMRWQPFIGQFVSARIVATWNVLIGQI